jgi:hypothetical protein
MRIPTNTDTYYFKHETLGMIALPRMSYPSSFHVFDVLEHKLDGVDGWLTRDEDHWNVSPEVRVPPVGVVRK